MMKRNTIITNDRMKMAGGMAVSCLLLFFVAGNLKAQNSGGPHVIKYNDTIWVNPADHDEGFSITYHYLAHVYNESSHTWELQDATDFSPACIWMSDQTFSPGGTNKNYYFYDESNHPRFLAAPNFTAGGAIGISASSPTPTATDLGNPEYRYYFYKWDNGLGRGVQYYGVDEHTCVHEWKDDQCWEVYWVAFEEATGTWKLSEEHYNLSDTHNTEAPEPRGARYSSVVVEEHPQDTATTQGGLAPLVGFVMQYEDTHVLSASVGLPYKYSFTPVYTTYTVFDKISTNVYDEIVHNYYGGEDHGTTPPEPESRTEPDVDVSYPYHWTLSGAGATYLSFAPSSNELESYSDAPTVYYRTENTTGDKTALLTLTVTYNNGAKQHRTAVITVKTPCQNPGLLPNPVVTYTDVTVSWYPTASSYKVYWKKNDPNVTAWSSANVGNVTSYAITGLDFGTPYLYKVQATSCEMSFPQAQGSFTTKTEPEGMMVFGAIFGGGRMADVTGKTEVVIVNCDSIGAIYGGNDIAGRVVDAAGSLITLGVNDDDPNNYDDDYGTTDPNKLIKVGSVYGGGNGNYSYGSTSFDPIGVSETTASVGGGASVYALSKSGEWNVPVWTNPSTTEATTLTVPSITKTKIVVTDNYVKTDSIFGGAKNAFLTLDDDDAGEPEIGSDITINGGTHMAVFGGNNVGGSQGTAKHYIKVNKTTTNLVPSIQNTATTGYGRDFGIRYLFGGGNKVLASATEVLIQGGQLDTIFAGGNSADVAAAQLTVECSLGAHTADNVYGNTYTNAINNDRYISGSFGNKAIDTLSYNFDGYSGIYNVRTLFGGNNQEPMHIVPQVTLTSGSVGTVYGGGNAGDMVFQQTGGLIEFEYDENINDLSFDYSTHVVLNSEAILVDYLYGGCQMSNVLYSTWVELQEGHVGTVYGGCNISGDVGSTRVNPNASYIPHSMDDQAVYGSTYVKAGGYLGTGDVLKKVVVYNNLYAGSNGYYDCSTDGIHYNGDAYYDDQTGKYEGLTLPTHNETHVVISDGARIRENVYAGGNMACVGFDDGQGTYDGRVFPELVGEASVRMDGGRVEKNVYGGCNMSNIYGSNEVRVSGGYIGQALYGGNDRSGQVAEKTNRFLPPEYTHASDNYTSLTALGVKTYVGVKGSPRIGTVYGGGNGAYADDEVHYCSENYQPIQSYTFVDIHINGGASGGHIGTVYGGGNGVTVRHGVTVFLNVQDPDYDIVSNHVDTIFGGNNKGNLDVVADILLVHGKVGTVYGGCNQGAMVAEGINTVTFDNYNNIGSYVRLMETYDPDGVPAHLATVTAEVTEAIYGGCRMNGVTNSSLVLVEGGDFSGIPIFGGSDVSGHIGGWSRVAVNGILDNNNVYIGGIVGNVYGGGNGDYIYENNNVYTPTHVLIAEGTSENPITAPTCANSGVDIWSGQVGIDASHKGNVFGGGYGQLTSTDGNVIVNIGVIDAVAADPKPLIYGDIYGGSAFGNVNTEASGTSLYITNVNFLNGTLHGNLYGGGLGRKGTASVDPIEAKEFGSVLVNISNSSQAAENCFIDLRDANVFGCNNENGSPQNNVRVDVWKTAYNFSDYTSGNNYTSQDGSNGTGAVYAINQVFGGGNQADYAPLPVSEGEQHKTLVFVHDCLNTIGRVFSGGNAAAASCVATVIQGGRFNYIFGGGNGEVDPADIGAGGTDLVVAAGIVNHLFGGSNSQGSILGPVNTEINASGMGESCSEDITEFFGGSNQAALGTSENPATVKATIFCEAGTFDEIYGGSNLADIIGDVTLTIRGGTCIGEGSGVYGGSKGQAGEDDDDAADITGNVTLNLEGGTITNAYGGSNINGNITGDIVVNVIDLESDCSLDLTNVYGGGNLTPYTPTTASAFSPVVNVIHIAHIDGIKGNVFGGGNLAVVNANPRVNIGYDATAMSGYLPHDFATSGLVADDFRAFVTGNVFGGGNEAGVGSAENAFNTTVMMYDGTVMTGIYGGCNTSGTVAGNTRVELVGGTVGSANSRAGVFGGGYGQSTEVAGNVHVIFGDATNVQNEYPMLYGDLYGGSALGNVNTNNANTTTVDILNGIITGTGSGSNFVYGNVFGGGLGRKAATGVSAVEAKVFGRVQVNIGVPRASGQDEPRGKATLVDCNVYGCNNQNGSPQDVARVDVYQSAHTNGTNGTPDNTFTGDAFAIKQVFGGGKEADYIQGKRTYVHIHYCENTIDRLFGGGDASDVWGVELWFDGGRYSEVFGGGNGELTAANITSDGITVHKGGGLIGSYFDAGNMLGSVTGTVESSDYDGGCGAMVTTDYFLGGNNHTIYGDLEINISCGDAHNWKYKNFYGGTRLAQVYGNIRVTIHGGIFENVYGGSKGSAALAANINDYTPEYITAHPELNLQEGEGGNITLNIFGGTIGNLFGGCDVNGSPIGKITINVQENDENCPLYIGNIYGGGNQTNYTPTYNQYQPTNPNALSTPEIKILKAHVGGDVPNDNQGHPLLPVINPNYQLPANVYEGNVFGGGKMGDVTGNPKVVLGDPEHPTTSPVTIEGNVYGGGEIGKINGSTQVIIVPTE